MTVPIDSDINFAKYRRPELAEHLGAIIDIPGTLKSIVLWGALSALAVWAAAGGLFYDRVHWGLLVVVLVYVTLCAILAGMLAAAVSLVGRRIGNLIQVIDITLEISQPVSADVAEIRGGGKRMPTPRQIIYGVYDNVVLPTLEGVVRRQSRLIDGAIFLIYRWSLGRLIARVLREASHDKTLADAPQSDNGPDHATLNKIDATARITKQWISEIRAYLTTAGATIRRIVMVPLVAVLVSATLFAALPVLALWYFVVE